MGSSDASAVVLGDLDLVRPLRMAGIRCAVVAPPGDPARFTRKAAVLGWADPRNDPAALVALLRRFGEAQRDRPVLFFESDDYTLLVSRHRDDLSRWFRFSIADRDLVETLIDKRRFRDLAQDHGLPVPASRLLMPGGECPAEDDLPGFPLLVKPATRAESTWTRVEAHRKAVHVADMEELRAMWPRLEAFAEPLIAQELVPGPETNVVSYHCYAPFPGRPELEFTGRKVRTRPVDYGHSTALVITEDPPLRQLGRAVVEKLGLTGVAKLDFKVSPAGELLLLEINPRFNLWHHPGAYAGVNLPAAVWADLTGNPRPVGGPLRPGTAWMSPWDLQAALESGVPLREWLQWARRCRARSMMAADDPLPFLRLCVQRGARGASRIRARTSMEAAGCATA